ncbi:carbamoyltransferase N-terminal domain-containing protein [Thermodesulfobacteriota bacterium]
MYVMGLSSYSHESSCCLLKDGNIVSLLEEERFNRQKHTWEFPYRSIKASLELEGITIDDIDCFTFFWSPLREITRMWPRTFPGA